MPFTAQRLDILADDCFPALFAFRSLSFCALRLAIQTPGVPILLDMGHALLERIATFSTEEMSIVPIFAQSDHVLTNDRGLAVFAFWCESVHASQDDNKTAIARRHLLPWSVLQSLEVALLVRGIEFG